MHRPPRSFKPRRRGLSPARAHAYQHALQRWGLDVFGPRLDLDGVFGSAVTGRVVLDIGFGSGEAFIELADVRRDEHIIGVDVHTPGVAAVLDAVEQRGLTNVRLVEGDALEFAERLPHGSLSTIRAFFPDPWPKRRQHIRRLVRPDVLDVLVPLLRQGGQLHFATDDVEYAAQIQRVCGTHPDLHGGVIARPAWRPVTRYEQRAIDAGRTPIDLLYSSSDSSARESSNALM
jgi:tRNA (guanine-N7-)-methyltransferase